MVDSDSSSCPTCGSHEPMLVPTLDHSGEVTGYAGHVPGLCSDAWHTTTPSKPVVLDEDTSDE